VQMLGFNFGRVGLDSFVDGVPVDGGFGVGYIQELLECVFGFDAFGFAFFGWSCGGGFG